MTYESARAVLRELAAQRRAELAAPSPSPSPPRPSPHAPVVDALEIRVSIDHRPLLWPFPVWLQGYRSLHVESPGDAGMSDTMSGPTFTVSGRGEIQHGDATTPLTPGRQSVRTQGRVLAVSAAVLSPATPVRCHGLLHLGDGPWLVLDPIEVNVFGWHLARVADGRRAALLVQRHTFGESTAIVTLHDAALDLVASPEVPAKLANALNERLTQWDVTRSFFMTPWITLDGLPRARTFEGDFIGPDLDEERPGMRGRDLAAVEGACALTLARGRALAAAIGALRESDRRQMALAAPYVVDARDLALDHAAWVKGVRLTCVEWEKHVRVVFASWDEETERLTDPDDD